ncbi:MAG: TetR/AcrR family transcriptional regulator [Acidimicrobiia bacterium]|nr:TetR/AcrR family transcriptional regulator [Acidimicrobiia bacterium]
MDPVPAKVAGSTAEAPADRRRAEIIFQAAVLFDRNGYHSTSMEDIATAIGLRKPTLYHYVSSKEEILFLIHKEAISVLVARHQARQRTSMPMSHQLLEIISDILEVTGQGGSPHGRVFLEHYRELPEQYQAVIRAERVQYTRMVEDVIRAGIERGELEPVDPRITAFALIGMAVWSYQWYRVEGPLGGREIAYQFWDILLKGIARRTGTDGGPVAG